ncbi:hypothetical protein AVEN_218406-1 [Araneus ventricosus]|uniref:Uncharacterized protein n=1 Tax=Araneus ventricosus TaxID=182803 RepID=A0A4Y2BP82_ARAVE|nr:hypothetical protein AVEN_72859-1 [Araneus ventricosus]GBL93651.1 hypothetical protein AVEN_87933-1 [Araneus ventricosus]GBL93656.1 hypothetical protein AVEN_200194-1 [Araneus ventricosus]GBL93868.1 hypothetical protein AVEN_218406-1 [Araneus ventricosus]
MGSNRFGQLGWGEPGLDYCMPQRIEKLKGVKVSRVSCGDTFTLFVTHGKELLSCGKSPSSLISKEESVSYSLKNPKCLKGKPVHYVSSYGENCIVLAEDQ